MLNQKGFTQYIIMGALAIAAISVILCYTYSLKNKALKAEVRSLKAEVATLSSANDGLAKNLEKERKTNTKAIAFYQEKLNECMNNQQPCEVIVIQGCPVVAIEERKGVDQLLDQLREAWK